MNSSPTIVVVTVSKGDPPGLTRTLRSAAEQELQLSHLVVLGDRNPENLDIVQSFRSSLSLQVLNDQGRGPYDAMNQAIARLPDHSYAWFLNSGDTFSRPSSTALARGFMDCQPTWGFGPVIVREEDGRIRKVTKMWPYTSRDHANQRLAVCHQAVVARVGEIRQAGGFDVRLPIAADFKLLLRLGLTYPPRQWDVPLVDYRAGGLSDRRIHQTIREQTMVRRMECPATGLDAIASPIRSCVRHSRAQARLIIQRLSAMQAS